MDRHQLWRRLLNAGVVRSTGQHIVLSTREHTEQYANFVSSNVPDTLRNELVAHLATEASSAPLHVRPHGGTAFLGIGCGYWYAAMLAEHLKFPSVYATKRVLDWYGFDRGQADMLRSQARRVVIVDDVRNSGASLQKLVELVDRAGVELLGALYILDRSATPATDVRFRDRHVPVRALFTHHMPTWPDRESCPLCAQGIPYSTDTGGGVEEFHRFGQPQK